ncbi:MAG: Gfo/Idh/MocA family oxidoreductase [bacterium]|nr:Gfo/Idh/MocA family oxidoreductase [bacterium]
MKRIRLGLVGAGAIGVTHAQAAQRNERVALVAICDEDIRRATALAPAAGARAYDSINAMRYEEDLDGVIVATPPASHASIARSFLDERVHVLCEKPLATSVAAAQAMIQSAERSGAILTMASKFRFVEDIRLARAMIEAGELGEVLALENTFSSATPMSGRWNGDPAVSGGGVIIDNGTHAVDLFRYLCGPLHDVRATEYHCFQRLPVEDTAMLFARCENGALATSDLSWSVDKRADSYLRVHGTRVTLEIGWQQSRMRRDGDREWRPFGSGYAKMDAFSRLLENFADAIGGKAPPEVSNDDALASVLAIDAAYRSLHGVAAPWA